MQLSIANCLHTGMNWAHGVHTVWMNMHHVDDEDVEWTATRGRIDEKAAMSIDDDSITIQGQA